MSVYTYNVYIIMVIRVITSTSHYVLLYHICLHYVLLYYYNINIVLYYIYYYTIFSYDYVKRYLKMKRKEKKDIHKKEKK